MNLRRAKLGLWLLAALFIAVAVAAVVAAVWLPYDQPILQATDRIPKLPTKTSEHPTAPALPQFAKLWDKELRPPLFDPPPEPGATAVAPETRQKPRPDIRLIGIAVEEGRSLAMLLGPDGKVEFLAIEETFHGVTVRSITLDGVLLDYEGDEYILKYEDNAHSRNPIRQADRTRANAGGNR